MNSYITQLIKQYNFFLKNLSFDQQKQIRDYQLLVVNVNKNSSKITRLQLKPLEEITGDDWAVLDVKDYSSQQLEQNLQEYSKRGIKIEKFEYNLITSC